MRTPAIIKSVMISDFSKRVAEKFGTKMIEVLIGFKYISEVAPQLEAYDTRAFESYGYLTNGFVWVKDAIQIVPMMVKLASPLKNRGLTLMDCLNDIYHAFGYQMEKMFNHKLEDIESEKKISGITERLN